MSWIAMRCVGVEKCGSCVNACAKRGISPGETVRHAVTQEDIRHVQIDRVLCDACGSCAAICYPKALSICGVDYTVDDLMERVSKDIPFYENSGGGVTISGGEPLCQPEFTLQFLMRLKERGIHTALDTTGCVSYDIFERVLPYTDLFLYDLKHINSGDHEAVIGVRNELILENARRLAGNGGKMQIRIPVIPRFNDSPEVIEAAGAFCKSLGGAVTVIQLLPYHNLGVVKYQRIGGAEKVLEAVPPTDEKIASLKQILENQGLAVTVH